MPVEVRDVLKINIVLVGFGLLNNAEDVRAFSNAVKSDVVPTAEGLVFGFSNSPAGLGRKLALQRDRISIDLTPDRTAIEREFPAESDLDRLAEIYEQAVKNTKSKRDLRAHGYNLELVFDQTSGLSSLRYLGDRLFGSTNVALEDWVLAGGSGKLVFDSPAGRWTVLIEPRLNDENSKRVFLNLNLHKADSQLPELNEVRRTFTEVWEKAHYFVKHLDKSVSI